MLVAALFRHGNAAEVRCLILPARSDGTLGWTGLQWEIHSGAGAEYPGYEVRSESGRRLQHAYRKHLQRRLGLPRGGPEPNRKHKPLELAEQPSASDMRPNRIAAVENEEPDFPVDEAAPTGTELLKLRDEKQLLEFALRRCHFLLSKDLALQLDAWAKKTSWVEFARSARGQCKLVRSGCGPRRIGACLGAAGTGYPCRYSGYGRSYGSHAGCRCPRNGRHCSAGGRRGRCGASGREWPQLRRLRPHRRPPRTRGGVGQTDRECARRKGLVRAFLVIDRPGGKYPGSSAVHGTRKSRWWRQWLRHRAAPAETGLQGDLSDVLLWVDHEEFLAGGG